jgi:hypothetical protein
MLKDEIQNKIKTQVNRVNMSNPRSRLCILLNLTAFYFQNYFSFGYIHKPGAWLFLISNKKKLKLKEKNKDGTQGWNKKK